MSESKGQVRILTLLLPEQNREAILKMKEAQTFKYMDGILVCDHSYESYEQYFQVVLLYKMSPNFKSMDETSVCDHSYEICRSSNFAWHCLFFKMKFENFSILNLALLRV